MLSISPLVNAEYIDKSYNNVLVFIRNILMKSKTSSSEDEELINSDSFNDVYSLITKSINIKLINLLPHAQFQNLR